MFACSPDCSNLLCSEDARSLREPDRSGWPAGNSAFGCSEITSSRSTCSPDLSKLVVSDLARLLSEVDRFG